MSKRRILRTVVQIKRGLGIPKRGAKVIAPPLKPVRKTVRSISAFSPHAQFALRFLSQQSGELPGVKSLYWKTRHNPSFHRAPSLVSPLYWFIESGL